MKKIGYSFWGFLADIKKDKNLFELSTPDGNAFYSWSIINVFVNHGFEIVQIMPDRDKPFVDEVGADAFSAFSREKRFNAYLLTEKIDYLSFAKDYVFSVWDKTIKDCTFILHEWRMKVQGRNECENIGKDGWQPDLLIQEYLLEYCNINNIKLMIFDLDYKISFAEKFNFTDNVSIIELGTASAVEPFGGIKVYIPFDFSEINQFSINECCENDLVYVGNRYERDWCIDKYIAGINDELKIVIHGNWLESGRDSADRWKMLKFGKRLQTKDMHNAYSSSVCTILLAKMNYCVYNFMTARIIESIFYGSVPLFICEYGEETIKEYAGVYYDLLTVKNADEVARKIRYIKENNLKAEIICYLRKRLAFMDAENFYNKIKERIGF